MTVQVAILPTAMEVGDGSVSITTLTAFSDGTTMTGTISVGTVYTYNSDGTVATMTIYNEMDHTKYTLSHTALILQPSPKLLFSTMSMVPQPLLHTLLLLFTHTTVMAQLQQ